MNGYEEIAKNLALWTIRDKDGFPAPINSDGQRAQPFWPSKSKAESLIKSASDYDHFDPYEISWEDFSKKWVPGLNRDKILVGYNWAGERATGYDIAPSDFESNVKFHIDQLGDGDT